MVGLGEQRLEVHQVMDDMRSAGVDFLTMGQYLQPTPRHAKVEEFVTPQAFDAYAAIARAKGFLLVAASPLTRSSYHAGDDFKKMQAARAAQLERGLNGLMPRHSETQAPSVHARAIVRPRRRRRPLRRIPALGRRGAGSLVEPRRETVADLVVGFNAFKERFTSRVTKERPEPHLRRLCRGPAQISAQ